jgi:hypothetical protein
MAFARRDRDPVPWLTVRMPLRTAQ